MKFECVSLSDAKEFLETLIQEEKFLKIFKDNQHFKLNASCNFEDNKNATIELENDKFILSVNPFSFKIYLKQFSNSTYAQTKTLLENISDNWQKYLLAKYGVAYARYLYAWCDSYCEKIRIYEQNKVASGTDKHIARKEYISKTSTYKRVQRDLVVRYGIYLDATYTNFT